MFYDKYIIRLPSLLRWVVAFLISTIRNKTAKEIYSNTGNKSPILEQTEKQARSLQKALENSEKLKNTYKVFIAMRHWKPFAKETIKRIKSFDTDEIILLPLYPQFSTTTTYSSIEDFNDSWKEMSCGDKQISFKTICCYPIDESFVDAHVKLIQQKIKEQKRKNYRLLFSAHGLPKKIIKDGDPYQWQVEQTVMMIVNTMSINELDYKITYLSRVGPVEWLKPNTEDEIKIAAEQDKDLIIVPIAFVSEHVETLVELDIEYAEIAKDRNINYTRVPALCVEPLFVNALVNMVYDFEKKEEGIIAPSSGSRLCPKHFKSCPCRIREKKNA